MSHPVFVPRRAFRLRAAIAAAAVGLTMAGGAFGQAPDTVAPPVKPMPPPVSQPGEVLGESQTPLKEDAQASPLTAEILYKVLVGDIALQRGEAALAARAYFEAARDADDVTLARRATEIALFSRQRTIALEAAKLWQKLDPSSERAKQMAGSLEQASGSGDLKGDLERALADSAVNGKVGEAFMQINRALSERQDRSSAYRLIVELAKPYPDLAEAHYAVALAALGAGVKDFEIAGVGLREVDRALELKPDWERAALLKADILARNSPDSATRFLNEFLAAHPESKAAATALAQVFVEQKRYGEARAIYQKLWDRDPSARELEFAVAAVSVQMKDYPTAERLLLELKQADYTDAGDISFFLGQIAEDQKRYDDAIVRYREVSDGDRVWPAKLRIAGVMAKQGELDGARKYLRSLEPETVRERTEATQAEAQVLREAGDSKGAYDVLDAALAGEPDSVDLLYDIAMVAEKLDRIDEAELRLKRLLEIKPDNAQALNALGYTLVDRTPRAQEGLRFIEKAYALSPDDAFILDSLGWGHYRVGNIDESERYLRRALAQRPDPEIAAHLGEVLWAKGERDVATDVWRAALKETPDNPVLLETVRRLSR